MFRSQYADVFTSNPQWNAMEQGGGALFAWNGESTYVQEPPFLIDLPPEPEPIKPITGARVLLLLGDSVTTDHISPAGAIAADSPAGRYLQEQGVAPRDFNSYGSRRGNDRVMTRGTFANIRIRNQLAPETEGGVTRLLPDGETMSVYEAAIAYRKQSVPLVVLAGAEYGTGSSRDWAAKGTMLLGVRAVIAASYERIHRSIWWAWVCCRSNFHPERPGRAWVLPAKRRSISPDSTTRSLRVPKFRSRPPMLQGQKNIRRENTHRYAGRDGLLPQRRYSANRASQTSGKINLSRPPVPRHRQAAKVLRPVRG